MRREIVKEFVVDLSTETFIFPFVHLPFNFRAYRC